MSGADDLRAVLDAIAIESPSRYVLDGAAREVAAAAGEPDGAPLVCQLQADMYTALYCGWTPPGRAADELGDRELVQALSRANAGHGTWEPGWIMAGPEEDGRLPVRKDGLTLWVQPGQLRSRGLDAHGQGPGRRPGSACRVRVGKELRELMPGFYFAIGDGDEREDRDADERMVRCYWHVDAAGAPHLIRALTEMLNPLRVPFRAKVVNSTTGYPRRDAGVLYLDRRYYRRVAAVLPAIHAALRDHLRDDVPRFTKRLAPGLAFAEDPANDESFGQHRCRVVAEALWDAFRDGVPCTGTLDHVSRALASIGLAPGALYLQPGSTDDYGALPAGENDGAPTAPGPATPRARRTPRGDRELRMRRKQERQWRRANRGR